MENNILEIVTIIVTLLMGFVVKKYTSLSSKKIPLQNVLIGLIVAIIEFIITKDFSTAIAMSGLTGGGLYDLGKNLVLIFQVKESQTEVNEDSIEELIEEGVVINENENNETEQ